MDDIRITTRDDARRIISAWTERYLEQPTTEQVDRAIRRLVDHIGGYGHGLTGELAQTFDLDAALDGRIITRNEPTGEDACDSCARREDCGAVRPPAAGECCDEYVALDEKEEKS